MKNKLKLISVILLSFFTLAFFSGVNRVNAKMPFYNLSPKQLVLRGEFFTNYSSSTDERKHNIALASSSINKILVDVGGEFSFNRCVGQRTAKRGYKNAKVIFDGKFIEGIGGGVCQVSTTLYNAVLLAGLKVIEAHPHSLPISYVLPSFDAMVNSSYADLKFVNNTKNPIIIKATADGEVIKIQIYGEEMGYKIERRSVIIEKILPPEEEIIEDINNEHPTLFEGERKVIAYGKEGLRSEGYLVKKYSNKIEKPIIIINIILE